MLRYLPDVVTLSLDEDECIGCEMCTIVCPHGVFVMNEDVAHIADRDACMECGACARNCPTEAIAVQAGVGCAEAVLYSAFRSRKNGGGEASCCCSDDRG